jgi:fructose-1-phosphate kinase PfkB-like protein
MTKRLYSSLAKDTLFAAAKQILSFGPKQIVIKKGEHGAMLFEDGEFFTAASISS